jgi:hypothetical protein
VELEARGWYGFDHGGAHDKTGGVPPEGTPGWLLDACFCRACRTALQGAGLDPGALARQVRTALDAGYQRDDLSPAGPEPGGSAPLRAHGGTITVAGAPTVGSSRSLGGPDGPAGALAAVRAPDAGHD